MDLPQNLKRVHRLDNNHLFDSETEDNLESLPPPPRPPFYKRIPFFKQLTIVIFIQFFLFFLFSFVLSKEQALGILKTFEDIFISQYNSNFISFLFFYFFLCFVSIACVIPTISVVVIMLTLVSKSILIPWSITLVFYLIIESILFFIFKSKYKHKINAYVRKFR